MLLTTGAGFGYPTVPLCVLSWAAGTTDVFIRELEREGVRARFMDKDLRVAVCEVDRQVDRFSLVSCFSAMLLGTSEWLETSSDATAKTEDSTAQVMLGKSSDPIVKEDSSGGSPGAAGSEFLKAQPEQNPWKQASDGPQECSSEKEISNQKSCRETSRTFRLLPQKRGEEINMSHINAALAEMFSSEGVGDEAERVLASRDSWRISTLRETNYRKGHCPHKFKSPEVVKSVPYRLEDVIGPARMNALPDIRMEDPGVEILVYIKDNFIALCYTQRDVPPPLIHSTLPFGKGQVRSRAADEVAFFVALSALHEFSFDRAGVGASCKEEKDRLHCMVLADHTGTRGVDGEGIGLLADQEAAVRQDSCRAEAQGMCCDVDAREKFCDYSDVGLSLSMRGKGRSGEESSCCTEVKVTGSGTERKWCKDKPLDDGCVLQGDSESVGGRGLVCLDPMCGVGTFPLALAFVLRRHHPTRCGGMKIWGTEECEESVSTANRNLRPGTTEASSAVEQDESQHDVQAVPRDSQPSETSIAFAVEQADDLSFLANDSVDMIVVDPPWGHRHGGFKVLNKMTVRWVREWGRVLRPHTGVMAIVTIRTTQMENMVLPQLHRQIGLRLIRPPIVFDNKGFHFCKLFLIKKVPEEATAVPTKSFT